MSGGDKVCAVIIRPIKFLRAWNKVFSMVMKKIVKRLNVKEKKGTGGKKPRNA